jgi:NAD(P)-dependent dehydrogenase (short-subunit alcohol dehydrogenase family)
MHTTLITGANRGIGLEFTRIYAARGDHVIAACRASSPALDEMNVHVEIGVDVTSSTAVDALATRLAGRPLDLLVLNAGVLHRETLDNMDFDSIRHQFEVNALGPLRVVHALQPCLGEGSKIAIITSRMGSLADNSSGARYGYRMSKAAVNMAGVSLAHDLRPRGVAVGLLHPGFVRTDMTGGNGNWNADEAAGALVQRIDELNLQRSGSFWHANGEPLPW